MSVKGVAILVFSTANFCWCSSRIDLENGVLGTINVRIHSHTEEMLMIVGIDAWIDLGSPTLCVLSWIHCVCVQNAGKLDLELDGAILVENPVYTIFVIRCRENMGDQ